jgi:L-amino acid N-acyltransferase YncA
VTDPTIRRATDADLDGITRIYVSFDTEPWPRERRIAWWDEHQGHPRLVVLVADVDGDVVGAAYSSWYRPKVAYERSVETSIVLDGAWTGRGLGRRLYSALLDELAEAGTHRAYAVEVGVGGAPDGGVSHRARAGTVRPLRRARWGRRC